MTDVIAFSVAVGRLGRSRTTSSTRTLSPRSGPPKTHCCLIAQARENRVIALVAKLATAADYGKRQTSNQTLPERVRTWRVNHRPAARTITAPPTTWTQPEVECQNSAA